MINQRNHENSHRMSFLYKKRYMKGCGIDYVSYITETAVVNDSSTIQTIIAQIACIVNW